MATIMEKDSLLHMIAYATSLIILKLDQSEEREQQGDFLAQKREYVYATPPEQIDLPAEVAAVREVITRYEHLPNLPQFQ